MRVIGAEAALIAGFALLVLAGEALAGEPPLRADQLRLRGSDLPKGWTTLPKEVESEEVAQIRKAFETVSKQYKGLSLFIQGIDAAGEKLNLVFIGFPDKEGMKKVGPLVSLLFSKCHPRSYGTVTAMVLCKTEKLVPLLHEKIARRHAFARLETVERMIGSGREKEAVGLLGAMEAEFPDVSELFLRVGELYLFHIRPPRAPEASKAFLKAVALHAKDPLDPILLANAWSGAGRAQSSMGDGKKALASLEKGVRAAEALAPCLGARILLEKARVQLSLDDEDGVHDALKRAFELDGSLGFCTSAQIVRDDPLYEDLVRKSRFSSMVSRALRVRPKEILVGPDQPGGVLEEPMALLPIHIKNNRNPAAGFEEFLEKTLTGQLRTAGSFGIDYRDWRQISPVRWTARDLAVSLWDAIEQYGCFDLRLTGVSENRGRGAEIAAFASDQARQKGIAHRVPVRILFVTIALSTEGKRTNLEVTAGLVEETGTVLAASRFTRSTGTAQKSVRQEIGRIGAEIVKRLIKGLK